MVRPAGGKRSNKWLTVSGWRGSCIVSEFLGYGQRLRRSKSDYHAAQYISSLKYCQNVSKCAASAQKVDTLR